MAGETGRVDMWPKGRLNRKATDAELIAERAWQADFVARLKADGDDLRAGWVRENIREIDSELKRRAA